MASFSFIFYLSRLRGKRKVGVNGVSGGEGRRGKMVKRVGRA